MNKKLLIPLVAFFAVISIVSVARAVTIPGGEALFETSLQVRISSTDTSMTLVANSLKGSQTLSGYHCLTIDEGRSDQEFVCGTVSGTSVTSLTRGVSLSTGTTTVASLQVAHRKGADVKVTDYPLIQILRNLLNGMESIPNLISYVTGTDCSPGHAANALCSGTYLENYANNVIAGGSPTSTEAYGGKVELGTIAEQAASFDGGAAKPTVLQTKNATSGCQVVGTYALVASSTTGKLSGACLDTTNNSETWAQLQTFTSGFVSQASSTHIGTTTQIGNFLSQTNIRSFTSGTTTGASAMPMAVVVATTTGTTFPTIGLLGSTTQNFAGFAVQGATIGGTMLVQTQGVVSGFSGLTPGSLYYLANATGTISTTPGTLPKFVGQAISATQLWLAQLAPTPTQVTATFTSPASGGSPTSGTATCPAGKTVVGGGFNGLAAPPTNSTGAVVVMDDGPNAATNSWFVQLACNSGASSCNTSTVTVYAICVNP